MKGYDHLLLDGLTAALLAVGSTVIVWLLSGFILAVLGATFPAED